MRLARVRDDERIFAAAVEDDLVVELGMPMAAPTADPILDWLRGSGDLSGAQPVSGAIPRRLSEVEVLAPIERPGKIMAVGLNYIDHTVESGLAAPTEPLLFAKFPSSVTGPLSDISVPSAITTQIDWEAELAVVLKSVCGPARRGTLADVGAYTVANDVSARDLQFSDGQWTRGKSLDTFCPIGPVLVTPEDLTDPQSLRIYAEVNGQTMQDALTADMIYSIEELLDAITATITLEPGDIILTGTPPGVGGFRTPPIYLQDGDLVEVGVDGIGRLRNRVRFR